MHTPLESPKPATLSQLRKWAADWILDCEIRQLSRAAIEDYKLFLRYFFWFLESEAAEEIGTPELKRFAAYLSTGHTEPGGRWGNPKLTKPLSKTSVCFYLKNMRVFYNFLLREEFISVNPTAKIKSPIARTEAKQPLTDETVSLLLAAAKRSNHPRRNEALLLVLLDTGVRASEFCAFKVDDLDMGSRVMRVRQGKGDKPRTCFIGKTTARALSLYLRHANLNPDSPLFPSDRGAELPMTRSGLQQLLKRLCRSAGVSTKGVSPHAFRRTFAVNLLRSGANVFSVQNMLGHTNLAMTRRYCAVAEADIQSQHRQHSPADRLKN